LIWSFSRRMGTMLHRYGGADYRPKLTLISSGKNSTGNVQSSLSKGRIAIFMAANGFVQSLSS